LVCVTSTQENKIKLKKNKKIVEEKDNVKTKIKI
jgi:hypothetical protein